MKSSQDLADTSVALVCESGGPYTQLKILEPQLSDFDTFYITFDEATVESSSNTFVIPGIYHRVGRMFWREFNREKLMGPFLLIGLCTYLLKYLINQKPDVVISTGNLTIAGPAFLFSKIMGVRTIYIEDIGQFDEPSTAGKVLYYLSDRFLVQNESTLKAYGPKAEYRGGVF